MKKLLFPLVLLLSYCTLFSQDTIFHFASTRPAFTEGALLVPKGKAQVELGMEYRNFRNVQELQHPSFQLKYGVSNFFEFRVFGNAASYWHKGNDSINSNATGLHPIAIGMKIKMIDAKRYAPASSFIGGLTANVISTKNFRTEYVAPYFKIAMEQFLPKNFGMQYNYGLQWDGETPKPTYMVAVSANYTSLLKKSTPEKHRQVKVFTEVYGLYPQGQDFDIRVNAGLAFLLNKWVQIDFSAGAGCTKHSPRFISSVGLALCFPNKEKKSKE